MEFFRISKDLPLMRYAPIFNVISALTFVLAISSLIFKGLDFSIEFTGGTQTEIHFKKPVSIDSIRSQLSENGFKDAQVQNFGSSQDYIIQLPLIEEGNEKGNIEDIDSALGGSILIKKVYEILLKQNPELSPEIKRVEFVGPQVGSELATDGIIALILVVFGIVVYLSIRFQWRFAIAAIIANLHDVIIILGFFAFFQWEFSLPVLAAVLAVLGYSVNESVVVFDRVRETFHKRNNMTSSEVMNHAITATMSRTVITHGCTQLMVTSMLIFGGAALHYFALALTIGILFGIYSSILVACPLALWFGASREQFIRPVKEKTGDGAVV